MEATEIEYHLSSDIWVLTALNEHLLGTIGNPFIHSPIHSIDVYWASEIYQASCQVWGTTRSISFP